MSYKPYSVTDLVISPRQVGTGQPAESSLENVDTYGLGSGCWCFVETGVASGAWQFVRGSEAPADGTSVIAPVAGPGRWFKFPRDGVNVLDLATVPNGDDLTVDFSPSDDGYYEASFSALAKLADGSYRKVAYVIDFKSVAGVVEIQGAFSSVAGGNPAGLSMSFDDTGGVLHIVTTNGTGESVPIEVAGTWSRRELL